MEQQDSSPIKNADLQDSSDTSLVDAMNQDKNQEEKQKMLNQEKEKSLEIIEKLKMGISTYDSVSNLN